MSMSGSKAFTKEHGLELRQFFQKCQKLGYGNPDTEFNTEKDGSTTFVYREGPWRYSDLWYGGEPFSGISTIWYDGVVCWSMVYWGRVMAIPNLDKGPVLTCLAEALNKSHLEHPWRGPVKFRASNGLAYRNRYDGSIRRFSGIETIIKNNKSEGELLYQCHYRGGVVNKDWPA